MTKPNDGPEQWEVPEADRIEQQAAIPPEDIAEGPAIDGTTASEADQLEQALPLPDDDADGYPYE